MGLAGIGQAFNGNGSFVKFLVGDSGQGAQAHEHPRHDPQRPVPARPRAARPARHAPRLSRRRAAVAPLVPCSTQALPNFNGRCPRAGRREQRMTPAEGHEGGLERRDQIERYRAAFLAVVVMVFSRRASAAASSLTRTSSSPAGCRCSGASYFTLKGEFQTAQAVTPARARRSRSPAPRSEKSRASTCAKASPSRP